MNDPMDTALVATGAAMEAVKTMLAALAELPEADARSLAVARTQFETAFLWAGSGAQGKGVLS
jgi:hypothetical protein